MQWDFEAEKYFNEVEFEATQVAAGVAGKVFEGGDINQRWGWKMQIGGGCSSVVAI